jgi:hypothetical protein
MMEKKRTEDRLLGSQPSSHPNTPWMMHDPIEEIKAASQAAFLGDLACRRTRCPFCNSPAV